MIDLQSKTLDELRAMDKEDIIKAIFEGETYSDPHLVKDQFGNNVELVDEIRQKYDGNLVGRRVVRWTYHDAKEGIVNEIITEDGKVRDMVTHPLDGRQPTLRRVPIAEPVPLEELGGMGGAAVVPEPVLPEPEPLILPVPLRAVEVTPEPVITEEPAIIEAPLTKWQRFKKRAERIIFLLPDDVV